MYNILLLSGFTKNVLWDNYGDSDYGKLSAKNHLHYALKHGYNFHCEIIQQFLTDRNQTWHKIHLIKKYLRNYDYIAWIDADAVFIKDDIKLEEFIDPSIDLILPEMQIDKRTGLQLTKTSTGFMIWKNCDWSFDLLNDMWNNSGDYAYGFFHEQSLLDTKILMEKESFFVPLNNVKIIPEKYHNTDSDIENHFIYHAGGNTYAKFSRIKEQLNKIIQQKTMNKKIYYKINCSNLGDALCSTPVVRKLSKLYNTKLNIINDTPEVFRNNPYVDKIISCNNFDVKNIYGDYEFFESFVLPGQKNQFNIERKFNTFDIRQIHAMDLGFSLMPEEMHCEFFSLPFKNDLNIKSPYVVLHTAKNWPNRTWTKENWQKIINYLNKKNIFTVLIGKKTTEQGSHTINKDFYDFENVYGLNLIDKTNLNESWNLINESKLFISFDTGPLHLAGTTDVNILHLGSAKDPRLIAPYRNGRQDYKYKYLKGSCSIYCTNNLKYSIKEWNTINAVPPLIGCLENKASFECQPSVNQVIEYLDMFL